MNINDLLDLKLPVHPWELEQANLKYFVSSCGYEWYKDKDNFLYAFNKNELKPFLDFYAVFDEGKNE